MSNICVILMVYGFVGYFDSPKGKGTANFTVQVSAQIILEGSVDYSEAISSQIEAMKQASHASLISGKECPSHVSDLFHIISHSCTVIPHA